MVHGEQLTKNLTLDLFHEIVYGIPIDEAPLFGVVRMKVEIKG